MKFFKTVYISLHQLTPHDLKFGNPFREFQKKQLDETQTNVTHKQALKFRVKILLWTEAKEDDNMKCK